MRAFMYRIVLTCINIFFPPLAVMMLCGASWDCMLNCCFFCLAVIPSHIHGFYISCTYFHRRHKVKKGRYPGGPKSLIQSENVLNGGASNAEVERLWRKEQGLKRKGSYRSADSGLERDQSLNNSSRRPDMVQRHSSRMPQRETSQLGRMTSNRSPNQAYGNDDARTQRWAQQQIAQDGYGPQSSPGHGLSTGSSSGSGMYGSRSRR